MDVLSKARWSVMFNYLFLVVWLAYGLVEVIAIRSNNNVKKSKLHVLALLLWIALGMFVFYQFFIAN